MTETSEVIASPETDDAAVNGEEVKGTEEVVDTPAEEGGSDEKSFETMMDEALKKDPRVIKVNGREKKITTYAEWQKYASLGAASSERFEEAKRMKEEAEQIRKLVEEGDVLDLLKKRGLQGDELKSALAGVVQQLLEEEEMDPRDRELRELKAEREQRQKAEKEAKEKAEQESYQKQVESEAKRLAEEIAEAAETFGLPSEPFLLQHVANELEGAFSNEIDMSVEDAVKIVRNRFMEDYTGYVRNLPLDTLKAVLGEGLVKQLQAEAVKAAKSAEKPFATRDEKPDASQAKQETVEDMAFGKKKKPKEKEAISAKDFFRQLELGKLP